MSFTVSPRAIRFTDAASELAEFEIKRGLMKWLVEKLGTLSGMMEYANVVSAAGDSLFGVADANFVDFVNHSMGNFDSSCWNSVTVSVVADYLVVAPKGVDLVLYERDIREVALGTDSVHSCDRKRRSQCPVCLWHPSAKKHCSVCWSRTGRVELALMTVDVPFYIGDDMVEFVQMLGLGNVIRSVDGVTRWWVRLDVASYFHLQSGVQLSDAVGRMSVRRQQLFGVATSLFKTGRVVLTATPSVSSLIALVKAEGERVGPLVFAIALALHLGAAGTLDGGSASMSVFSGQREAVKLNGTEQGARIEGLSLLAQVQLLKGSSYTSAILPSGVDKFLTPGFVAGMVLDDTKKYLSNFGCQLNASVRELSITRLKTGDKVHAVGSKRKSVQGLSPVDFGRSLVADALVREASPLSEVSAGSWSASVSPTSSVTTVNSLPGFADSFDLDSVVVSPYVPPSVESDAGSGVCGVDGHVYSVEEGAKLRQVSVKAFDASLFEFIKMVSTPPAVVEQLPVRPWYDATSLQGQTVMQAMPYLLDVYASAMDSYGEALMRVNVLKDRLMKSYLEKLDYYVTMGAVVDVIIRVRPPVLDVIDLDKNVELYVSVRAPSVDPLTRRAFEVANEIYLLDSEVLEGFPAYDKISPSFKREFSDGWLLARFVSSTLTAKRTLKLRTVSMNDFLNSGQLQSQLQVTDTLMVIISNLLRADKQVEAASVLLWNLNVIGVRSYKLVWKEMSECFDNFQFAMVTMVDACRPGTSWNIRYIDGSYEGAYNGWLFTSEKASMVVKAMVGMSMAGRRGAQHIEGYIQSVRDTKGVDVDVDAARVVDEDIENISGAESYDEYDCIDDAVDSEVMRQD